MKNQLQKNSRIYGKGGSESVFSFNNFQLMKTRILLLIIAIFFGATMNAQTTIFSENMGSPSGTTTIASNTFQNSATLTYTGTGDVRSTGVSSGYTGASGSGNVFITSTVGINFEIANINTSGFSALALTFGEYKSTTSTSNLLVVEVSSDGTTYTPLTYTRADGAVWALISPTGTIPSTANLRIRFRNPATTHQFRVDDVKLVGTPAVPTIALSDNGTQIAAANITEGTNTNILHKFQLAVTTSNAAFTGLGLTTAGSYDAADITNLKLRYSTDAVLDAADATLATLTSPGVAGAKSFSAFSQAINSGSTGYFFITTDIAGGASTGGNTISVNAITTANLTFTSGTKSGSTTAGGTQTIIAATTPAIGTSGTLSALSTTYGTASGTTSFTASGSALTTDITITAPAGFEISTVVGSGYASSLILTQTSGTVPATTLYVRLAATTAVGSYNGNIVLTSTGAATANIATVSSTVTPKALTITGIAAVSKIYNGNTTTSLTGTASVVGIVGTDNITLSGTPTATFATAAVGNTKAVTVSGYSVTGTAASNYTLTQPTGLSANITVKELTIAGAVANDKVYNGTTVATLSGSLTGVISPDVVTLSATGTFASANVGTAIAVTATSTLGGTAASNYTLTQPTGLSANITQASQTITFGALASKVTSDVPFPLTATASSGLAVTYVSSNTAVATVTGSTVTIVGAGTTTITASQAGNANYTAATDVQQSQLVTTGPCLGEDFSSGSLPSGWLSSSASIAFGANYADMAVATATLTTASVSNPASLTFNLTRTTNTTAKNLDIEISTTSQTSGFTVVQSYDHSNTTSGGTTACTVNLSAYTVYPTVYIRFNKTSTTTSPWRIDDISVMCGTACTPPSTAATSMTINNVTSANLNLNFTRGTGDGIIIIAKTASAATAPANGTDYSVGNSVGGGTVVYKGTANGANTAAIQNIASLTAGTLYYFSIYEYTAATNCYQATALTSSAYTLSTEPTAHSSFTNTVVAYNQINLSFPTTGIGADGFVILRRADGTSPTITGVTDGIAPASWALPTGTVLVTTTTSGTTYNNTGLTAATNYCYLLIPYKWNATNAATYNYYTTDTVPSSCGLTPDAPSTTSDIATEPLFGYTSNINYMNWQSTAITNVNTGPNGSIGVHQITIRDGGSSADSDTLPTLLTAITFNYTGTANTIRSAALFNTSNALVASAVTAGTNSITFSGLSGDDVTASDNGSISLVLRVTFNDVVTDNQKLVFTVNSATAGSSSASSQFAAANAGAATSDNSTDDKNRIEVTADRIAFVQQPSTTSINIAMAPTVTVSANDSNGNRDLDFANPITITSTGTLTGAPVSVTAANGLSSYSSLTHTAVGTGLTLTTTTTGLTGNTVGSGTFSITTITYTNNDYRSASSGTWLGTATATWEKYDSTTNSWALSTAPASSTSSSIYIMDGHTITTGSQFANLVNIKVLSGGSFISTLNSTANSVYIYNGGTLTFQSNSLTINNGFEIEDGGTFIFNYSANAGSTLTTSLWKGTENFHPNSNFIIKSHDTGAGKFFLPVDTAITARTYNGTTAYFGNLIIDNTAGQSGTFRLSSGGNFNNKIVTHKNLIFRSSNSNFIITDSALNLTIGNNLVIESGFGNNVSISTSAITASLTVNGDLTNASSNTFNIANNTSSNITLNVNGNIQLSSGGLNLNVQSGSTAVANLKGDLTVATAATITSTASGSTFNFTGTGDGLTAATTQNVSIASTAATRNQFIGFTTNSGSYVQLANGNLELGNSGTFTVKTGSTFDFGFNNTTPLVLTEVPAATSTAFTSQTGCTLKITSEDGINKTAVSIGNIQGIPVSNRNINQTATFHYIGKSNQVTGDAITTGGSAKNIICEMNADNLQLSFTNSTSIAAPGLLNIKKGQVIESVGAFITGNDGGLTMENNTLYQIPALSASGSDLIPRMSGNSSTYDLNGGTIQLNGAGDQELRGQRAYRNLTFSTSGTKTVSSSPSSITGTITTEDTVILDAENKTLGGSGTNLTMSGTSRYITAGSGTKPDAEGSYILNPGTTIEFTNSTGTLEELRLSPMYYNIDISGNNTGTDTLSSSINLQSGATFSIKSTGTFKLSNTTGFANGLGTAISSANNPILFMEAGSKVEYAGGNQSITNLPLTPPTSTYSNLKISGTGQKTIPAAEILVGNDLTITNSGAELQIGANQLLTVTNIINAPTSSEKITIANSGSLVQINEGVSNIGRMNMRRTSRTMGANDYIYWGSPVMESVSLPTGVNVAFVWDLNGTADGTWNYFSGSIPGSGFITRLNNPGQVDFDFKGTPTTGQVNVTALNYDGGTDQTGNTILLANPYASAIDAQKFVTDPDNSELKGTLYFWTSLTHVLNNQYTVNDYASWNITGATATSDLSNSLGLLPSGKIGAGQGFFAEMNTSGTISFHNNMRVRSLVDNGQFFRSTNDGAAELEQNRIWLNLTNTSGAFRQALVGYVTGATNEYERLYDGNCFTDNAINLYSLVDDRPLVIQGRSLPFEQTDLVPIGFKVSTAGTYTIAIDHSDGVFAGSQNIYLQDLLSNVIFDLKSGSYTFTSEAGTFDSRFVLRYTTGTLGTGTFDPENTVKVAVDKNILKVRSISEPIDEIAVFDISGRKVYEQKAVSSSEFQAADIVLNHQPLIIKISLANGQTINRKIVY